MIVERNNCTFTGCQNVIVKRKYHRDVRCCCSFSFGVVKLETWPINWQVNWPISDHRTFTTRERFLWHSPHQYESLEMIPKWTFRCWKKVDHPLSLPRKPSLYVFVTIHLTTLFHTATILFCENKIKSNVKLNQIVRIQVSVTRIQIKFNQRLISVISFFLLSFILQRWPRHIFSVKCPLTFCRFFSISLKHWTICLLWKPLFITRINNLLHKNSTIIISYCTFKVLRNI